MPDVYDISSWSEKDWLNTGGTRAKKYIESNDGKYYYFKKSISKPAQNGKPGKDFIYEFWSEIIAYGIGSSLGFNVLRYDIAVDGEEVGCISEDMLSSGAEELVSGMQYLLSYLPDFNPEITAERKRYTFQLIEQSLRNLKAQQFMPDIIKMILFDTIIGNGDRHQENWAFITKWTEAFSIFKEIAEDDPDLLIDPQIEQAIKMTWGTDKRFSPLFDNGSSLGRELTPERCHILLADQKQLLKYATSGRSSIFWEGMAISHFDLLQNLFVTPYGKELTEFTKSILSNYHYKEIEEIIFSVDNTLDNKYGHYKLPDYRKSMIANLVNLRIQRLKTLVW